MKLFGQILNLLGQKIELCGNEIIGTENKKFNRNWNQHWDCEIENYITFTYIRMEKKSSEIWKFLLECGMENEKCLGQKMNQKYQNEKKRLGELNISFGVWDGKWTVWERRWNQKYQKGKTD